MKQFKGIMEGILESRLISSIFSLYFHYGIYVFNTEGLSGSSDRKLLKQSLAYAAQLVPAHKSFFMSQHGRDTQGHMCIGTVPRDSSCYDLPQGHIFTKLLASSMHIL